jgi:hypothetical protein
VANGGGARPDVGVTPGLIYVGGMLRSGTTLLAQLLGNLDGCLAVGELRHCWAAFAADTPCSCGRRVRACPMWSASLHHALGPAPSERAFASLAARADRVLTGRRGLAAALLEPSEQFIAYREEMVNLAESVSAVTGARFLVDSSKSAAGLALWTTSPLPTHLVQIYRPAAAVAYSEARHVDWHPDVARYAPPRRSIAKSAMRWSLTNLAVAGMAPRAASSVLIRYDDLVSQPAATMEIAMRDVAGVVVPDPHVRTADKGHVLSGNPSLFAGPALRRADDSWRRGLHLGERTLVAALTLPADALLRARAQGPAHRSTAPAAGAD